MKPDWLARLVCRLRGSSEFLKFVEPRCIRCWQLVKGARPA